MSSKEEKTPPRDAGSGAAPHLQAKGIVKHFGAVQALRGADLEVRRGEVMGLVGDNGAGKSTLMKIIAGVDPADGGHLYLDGREIRVPTPHAATALGIQTVFQDLALCENLDVIANLFLGHEQTLGGLARLLPSVLRPLRTLEMEAQCRQAVSKLNVRTLSSVRTRVGSLSGGQRQAVAIARAVRAQSSVVLLDEPTAALGVAQTAQVLDVVRQLRENGHAVIYISHNLRDIFEVCDRITVLRHGVRVALREVESTNPDEIVIAITRGGDDDEEANANAA